MEEEGVRISVDVSDCGREGPWTGGVVAMILYLSQVVFRYM